jgi:hypothetical protein
MRDLIRKSGLCLSCINLEDWDENYDGDRWFSCRLDLEEDELLTKCPHYKVESPDLLTNKESNE